MLAQERASALVRQIVALDDADPQAVQALLARKRLQASRRGARIGGAEISNDRDAVLDAGLEDRPDEARELRLIAPFGILPARDLRERERALGESLEDQRGRAAARDECVDDRAGGIGTVAREPSAPADRQSVTRHRGLPSPPHNGTDHTAAGRGLARGSAERQVRRLTSRAR